MLTYTAPPPFSGLRLHLNEHTGGCSPAVMRALAELRPETIATYPDYGPATAAAARYLGVDPEWILLVNGLDEGLHVVALHASVRSGARYDGVVIEPAFEMYAVCIEGTGGRVVRRSLTPDFVFPLEDVLSAIAPATRVIYLCDPNNPTGRPVPAEAVEAIAAAAPESLVLLDEAYADFSGRSAIGPMLSRHHNLVVGRTFAKAHGLAGLRIGALVSHPDTLARLTPLLPPWSVNVAAAVALPAALADRRFVDDYLAAVSESRVRINRFAAARGLDSWPSEANFVLVRFGAGAATLVADLGARGVLVRDKSSTPGCAGCVRITAGLVPHTERCLTLMEEWLDSPGPR